MYNACLLSLTEGFDVVHLEVEHDKFLLFAEQVTLISQTEAPDSNVTEAQAKQVRFIPLLLCTYNNNNIVYLYLLQTNNFEMLCL